jgi:hypothetical protein
LDLPIHIAEAVKSWVAGDGTATAYIEKGNLWESGYVDSFNVWHWDELLDGEMFRTIAEARACEVRLHSSLVHRLSAPEVMHFRLPPGPATSRRPTSH